VYNELCANGAGSFNGWKRPFPMRRIAGSDDLVRSVLLPPGPTEFKFVVDGEWRYSPRDPVSSDVTSGTVNNCKMVQVNSSLCWRSTSPDQTIFVTGSFLAWSELVPLSYTSGGVYKAHCCLPVRIIPCTMANNQLLSSVLPCKLLIGKSQSSKHSG
jgi:hypothetical protein